MSLTDNIEEQREYLETNLEQLNTVVSAILGYKLRLEIVEKHNGKKTYFKIVDDRNIKDMCGVMEKAFDEVTISSFSVWWKEDGVGIEFDFNYKHIGCGSNGAKFCTIDITNGFVKIIT